MKLYKILDSEQPQITLGKYFINIGEVELEAYVNNYLSQVNDDKQEYPITNFIDWLKHEGGEVCEYIERETTTVFY